MQANVRSKRRNILLTSQLNKKMIEIKIISSHGYIIADKKTGAVISVHLNEYAARETPSKMGVDLPLIRNFNMKEFKDRRPNYDWMGFGFGIDILRLDYWYNDGTYERHADGY